MLDHLKNKWPLAVDFIYSFFSQYRFAHAQQSLDYGIKCMRKHDSHVHSR